MPQKTEHITLDCKKHFLETADYGLVGVTCYRGCLVHKVHGWYEILGKQVIKPQEVDEVIDKAGTVLSESITVKATNGSFKAQNTP